MSAIHATNLCKLNPIFAERIMERRAAGETGRCRLQQVALMITIHLCQIDNKRATVRHLSKTSNLDLATLNWRLNSLIQGGFITASSFLQQVNGANGATVVQYKVADEYALSQ